MNDKNYGDFRELFGMEPDEPDRKEADGEDENTVIEEETENRFGGSESDSVNEIDEPEEDNSEEPEPEEASSDSDYAAVDDTTEDDASNEDAEQDPPDSSDEVNIDIDIETDGYAPKTKEPILSDSLLNAAIRIMLGLICLFAALIDFTPKELAAVLPFASMALCGFPIFAGAINDIIAKKKLPERLFISIIAIISVFTEYWTDGVVMVLEADIIITIIKRMINNEAFAINEQVKKVAQNAAAAEQHIIYADKSASDYGDRWVRRDRLIILGLASASLIITLIGAILSKKIGQDWIHRGLAAGIASCPSFLGAANIIVRRHAVLDAEKNGIYFSDIRTFARCASLSSVVFDKLGTVTEYGYTVVSVSPETINESELMFLAAYAEEYSDDPIARAIKRYAGIEVQRERILNHAEFPGAGCIIQMDTGAIISAGNLERTEKVCPDARITPGNLTTVYITSKKVYLGRIDLISNIKPSSSSVISALRVAGVVNIALITGDNTMSATAVGRELGISEIYADCSPEDKIDRIGYIVKSQRRDERLAYVSHAGKDTDASELADVSIKLGGIGPNGKRGVIYSESDSPEMVLTLIKLAEKMENTARKNAALIFAARAAILVLALFGILDLWMATLFALAASAAALVLPKK